MKHFKPFRSVSDGDTYVGSVLFSPRGWHAHNGAGKYVV